jgi:uncharacterized membrane protein (DUF4010 family)
VQEHAVILDESTSLFFRFGVALVIGILVGLQREYASEAPTKELPAGVRTFGLLGIVGCSAALLSDLLKSPWPFVGTVFTMGIFFGINYYLDAAKGKPGLTTKVSLILTLLAGGLTYWPHTLTLAVAIAVTMTVLLSVKVQLHRFARHLTHDDVFAVLKFAVITAIVLPIVPNRVFGPPPFDIFNPFKLWLFVVFISGISFVGYVLIKVAGANRGIGLTGLLGGLASSTAVTLSLSSRSHDHPNLARPFALAIIVAWTVMFLRVLAAVAFLNVALVRPILIPVAASVAAGLIYCVYLYVRQRTEKHRHEFAFDNPFELGMALKFGLLFALILLFSRVGQVYFGNVGVYLSSFLSGMADVDAISFSMAKLSRGVGGLDLGIAARAIVIAATANTIVKGGIVFFSGTKDLKRAILPGFVLMTVVGITLSFVI